MTSVEAIIGVDLGGTKAEVALVDADGGILARNRLATPIDRGARAVVEAIADAARSLCEQAGAACSLIGVGTAGQVDRATGLVHFSPNLHWRDVPLAAWLTERLGVRAFVTNDVRAAALGEWKHGAGRGCDDLVCVYVGTGIGGGVISGGRLLEGASNSAAEVGHTIVQWNGPECTCGLRGCWEALAGGWAIAKRAREAIASDPSRGAALLREAGGDPDRISAETVSTVRARGDLLARNILDEAAGALVAGCVNVVHAFNPSRLILGGGVIEGNPWLVQTIADGVRRQAFAAATRELDIVPAQLGALAGALGAALYARGRAAAIDPKPPITAPRPGPSRSGGPSRR